MLPRDPALDTDRKIAERFERLERMIQSLRTEPLGQNDAWITPSSMLNGWADYTGIGFAACQYMKDAVGFVWVKGLVQGGTVPAAVFLLPSGYRPLENRIFVGYSNAGPSRVDVQSNGYVVIQAGGNGYSSLDSIMFLAEQ